MQYTYMNGGNEIYIFLLKYLMVSNQAYWSLYIYIANWWCRYILSDIDKNICSQIGPPSDKLSRGGPLILQCILYLSIPCSRLGDETHHPKCYSINLVQEKNGKDYRRKEWTVESLEATLRTSHTMPILSENLQLLLCYWCCRCYIWCYIWFAAK